VAFAALLCLAASAVGFPTDSQNVVTSLDVGEADGVLACTSVNCNGSGPSGGSEDGRSDSAGGSSYSSSSGGNPYSSSGGDSYSSSRNNSVAELGANLELSQAISKRKPGKEVRTAPKRNPKNDKREKKKRQEKKFPGSTSKDKFKNGQGQWQHGDTPNSKKNPYHHDETTKGTRSRHAPGTDPNDELGTSQEKGPPRGAQHAAKKKAAEKKKQKQIRKKEKAKKAPKKEQGKKAGKPKLPKPKMPTQGKKKVKKKPNPFDDKGKTQGNESRDPPSARDTNAEPKEKA